MLVATNTGIGAGGDKEGHQLRSSFSRLMFKGALKQVSPRLLDSFGKTTISSRSYNPVATTCGILESIFFINYLVNQLQPVEQLQPLRRTRCPNPT